MQNAQNYKQKYQYNTKLMQNKKNYKQKYQYNKYSQTKTLCINLKKNIF